MNKMNTIKEIDSIIVKVIYINSKNELSKIGKHIIKLAKKGILSTHEQASLLKQLKERSLPKKYICSCVLENQISSSCFDDFDFDKVELSLNELERFERNDKEASFVSSYEHQQLKSIVFKPSPLLLSDLNEIVVILREVSSHQIKTRKKRMVGKNVISKTKNHNITRRHKVSK